MNAALFAQEITELQTIVNQQKQVINLLSDFDKYAAKLVEMKNKLAAISPAMWDKASAKLGELLQVANIETNSLATSDLRLATSDEEPTIVAEEPIVVAEEPIVVAEESTIVAEGEKSANPYKEIFFSDRVSAFVQQDDWANVHCAYLGFNNKKLAERWGNELCNREVIKSFEVRKAERVSACKYETKVRGITIQRLEALAKNKNIFNYEPNDRLLNGINLINPVVIPVPTIPPVETEKSISAVRTKRVVNEVPYVGDWVEFLADGNTYQVEAVDKLRATLTSGNTTKYAYFNEIKVVMNQPSFA